MLNVAIRKTKNGDIIVFFLDVKCNPGNLWCAEIGMSGSECSYNYYLSTKKPAKEDVEQALKWLKERYNEDIKIYQRIPHKFLKLSLT